MTPLLLSIACTLPIIAVIMWLYLRLRGSTFPPSMHRGLTWAAFAFLFVSGLTYFALWYFLTARRPLSVTGVAILWVWGLGSQIVALRRRRK
jgi:hypothetical protein